MPDIPLRPASFRVSLRPGRSEYSAGAMPDTRAAATQITIVKPRMSPLSFTSNPTGRLVGGRSQQAMSPPPSKRHPGQRPQASQQQGFCQHLPCKPPAAGAQRQPDTEFLLPPDGAGQQQVGHVRAHDQKHHEAHRHQDLKGPQQKALRASMGFPNRQHRCGEAFVRVGYALRQLPQRSPTSAPRLFDRAPGLQPGDGPVVPCPPVVNLQAVGAGQLWASSSGAPTLRRSTRPMVPRNSAGTTPIRVNSCRLT